MRLGIFVLFYCCSALATPDYCVYGNIKDEDLVVGLWEEELHNGVADVSLLRKGYTKFPDEISPIIKFYEKNINGTVLSANVIFFDDGSTDRYLGLLKSNPFAYEQLRYLNKIRYGHAIYWGGYIGFPLVLSGTLGEMRWTDFVYCNGDCYYSNFVNAHLEQGNIFHGVHAISLNTPKVNKSCAGIRRSVPGDEYIMASFLPAYTSGGKKSIYPIDIYWKFEGLSPYMVFVNKVDIDSGIIRYEGVGRKSDVKEIVIDRLDGAGVGYSLDRKQPFGFDYKVDGYPVDYDEIKLISKMLVYGRQFFLVYGTSDTEKALYLLEVDNISENSVAVVPWNDIGFIESLFFSKEFWQAIVAREGVKIE